MIFEWDPDKNKINIDKHGIDFETAKNIWLDENRIEIHSPHPVEDRKIIIGKFHGKLWTAIYTTRDEATRIISVRRSRVKEVALYEKEEFR